MRKMKLDLEKLAVDSFEMLAAHGRGTVVGRMPIVSPPDGPIVNPGGVADTYPECPSPLCMDTPLASCDGSCQPGCAPGEA